MLKRVLIIAGLLMGIMSFAEDGEDVKPKVIKGVVEKVTIKALPEKLKYDVLEFTVKAGKKVTVHFINADYPPHNIVFVLPGKVKEVADAAVKLADKGFELKFIPPSKKHLIFAHSDMLDYEGEEKMEFKAPEKPGVYEFFCSFPGHAMSMVGKMKVVK